MYAKNFLNQVGDVKAKAKDPSKVLTDSAKGTMVGATIGAGIGVFIGFGRNKNLLMSGFIGAIIGGAISGVFIVKK